MKRIETLIKKHQKLRERGINLIASENYLSLRARKALASDLAGRYHSDYYSGSKYAREIIETTETLTKKLFRAKYAIITPLSGNLCDLAVLFALTQPNDKVAMLPFSVGGYPLGIELFHRQRMNLPVDEQTLTPDAKSARRLYRKHNVKLTILGSSFILFPHPVKEFLQILKNTHSEGCCVYDGSHILGLLACGEFQDPLREGAEILFGSTHKSFYGPQGGIVLTNSKNHYTALKTYLELDLKTGIGLIDNIHLNRIAALGIAIEEMLKDRSYGRRVIQNAQTLAHALDNFGVPVKFRKHGYTRSHQILLDLPPKRAKHFCNELEKVGIFIDIGGRLGTAEITHRGIEPSLLVHLAELITDVFKNGVRNSIREKVLRLITTMSHV